MEPVSVPSPALKMYWLPIHQYILVFVLDWSVHQSSPKYMSILNFREMNCRNFQRVCSLLLHRKKPWLDSIISWFLKLLSFRIQVKLENNCNLKGKFTQLDWNGLVWKNQMEPLQFQSIFKIVMVTQSIPGLVVLIGLISPRLDWLLIRCRCDTVTGLDTMCDKVWYKMWKGWVKGMTKWLIWGFNWLIWDLMWFIPNLNWLICDLNWLFLT